MGKCPVCKAEIDSLYLDKFCSAVVVRGYNVSYDEKSKSLEMTEVEGRLETDIKDVLEVTFYCPACNAEVANSPEGAIEILQK